MSLVLAGTERACSARLLDQLTQLGCPVLPAKDVDIAMSLCERIQPDMVIVNDLDQLETVASSLPRLPVVLATDLTLDAEMLLRSIHAGACDVWPLPMDAAVLSGRLDALAARRAMAASDQEARLTRFAREIERDQRAGRYIQMGMLPPNPMAIEGYRLQHQIVPSLILSGDFVDYFRITDRHFAFYVADVSGHGASSAFVTVLLKNFSRRLRREFRPSMLKSPGEILQWINRELLEQSIDKHVALLLGVADLETDEIRLVNGGHYPPAVLVEDGRSRFIEQKGKPVGLFDEVSYPYEAITLGVGDRLVMFSDGVLDVLDGNDLETKEGLMLHAAADGADVDGIWKALAVSFSRADKPDDMTCLMVQREN
jgi:serine phosphatase RsbU (regulator of sigma subunit)